MSYKKVDSSLNFVPRETETLKFWEQNSVFQKTIEKTKDGKPFSFYDGPPTANGKPHMGHVFTRTVKDIIPRYKTMKGYAVLRKAGWDTHGLPVELEVEKQLGLDGKQDIEKYGMEAFIQKCKESVWKYKDAWEKMSERLAYWVDMENPYITYDDNYIESVWWSLKEIFSKGYIYKGHKIVPYCPRCGTALSSHEVAQGYKDVKEKSIFVKFAVDGQKDTYLLAWTTTPWTLPSNVALCVNPNEEYSKIKVGGEYYWMATALISSLFEDYESVEKKKGRQLEFMKYVPLFDYAKSDKAFFVTCDNYVTLTDGTGIVHIAPAFGEDDAKVGRKYGLPFVQLVDDRGEFVNEAYDIKGMFAKDADPVIIENLKKKGLLLKELMYEHSYPFCWRCDTPLLYYARKSWFIKMTDIRDDILKSNNSVNWMPQSIGSGRMGNFLENVVDWGLSRERYWGTPLPLWICDKCGKIHAVGSKAELKEKCGLKGDIELHRPYVDECTFECECGGTYKRTPEVIDCWYDSGAMPFAQFHYPFENKEAFEKNFPADFISEAVDQTRGWFYTLLAISTLLFDKASFKNCIVLGHVGDKNGIKMSKHIGNVIDPWTVLDKQGADAVRWLFYTESSLWLPSRFSEDAVSEVQRKFLGTLWNTYAFFVLYADIDKFDPTKWSLKDIKPTYMDKWLLSELNALVKFVDEGLDKYQITETARKIESFVDDLSNWYVRRCRERYWGSEMTEDKKAAYVTLNHTLVTLSKLIAPYVPFVAEEIYQNLVVNFDKSAPVSVHLCNFPVCDKTLIDAKLQDGMKNLIDVVVLGRSARNAANIKNRQPLSALYVMSDKKFKFDKDMTAIAADELNVKSVQWTDDTSAFIGYELKPQMRPIGPKYGVLLGKIKEFLLNCDGAEVVNTVRSGKSFVTTIDGADVEFSEEDLLISTSNKKGFESASDKGITVVLDTNLTEELIEDGFAREIVSKIQTMRKESGFNVTDHIKAEYQTQGKAKEVFEKFSTQIASETLCDEIKAGCSGDFTKEWNINGESVTLNLTVVK
jgi:isoleucyl-tRNA synthetase